MPGPDALATLGVFVRERWLDETTCARFIDDVLADPGEAGEVFDAAGITIVDDAARSVLESGIDESLHDELTARLDAMIPELERQFDVSLLPCEGFSALRYRAGSFYGPHRDWSPHAGAELESRAVSIVIFLNGGSHGRGPRFGGGHLRFYELGGTRADGGRSLDLVPEAGHLVAFRSSVLHEVTPVEYGERFSLVTWLKTSSRV